MEINKILITPEYALELLSNNTVNRRVKESVVNRYVKDMLAGSWKEDTGELIKIAKDGTILDGQHRLLAIVKSGIEISLHVATGLSNEIFSVIDTGASRNASDTLFVNNINNAFNIARSIQFYESTIGFVKGETHKLTAGKKTNQEILAIYNSRIDFWDLVGESTKKWAVRFSKVLAAEAIGGLYSIFSEINKDKAYLFMDMLCTGQAKDGQLMPLSIHRLRETLIKNRLSTKRMVSTEKYKLITVTFTKYLNSK
jgi:hypothetical protein